MKLSFSLNFRAKEGEKLQILVREEGYEDKIHPMKCTENGEWNAEADHYSKTIEYIYQLTNEDGVLLQEEISAHHLNFPHNIKEYCIYDVWNLKNFPENYLNNKVLENKLQNYQPQKITLLKKHTHLFRAEVPLYDPNWKLVLVGNSDALGNWDHYKAISMVQTSLGIWETAVTIDDYFPIQYKYGIFDTNSGKILNLETGNNRFARPNVEKTALHIKSDHFFRFRSYEMYHDAGVAVPVFSLRSKEGFGVGEFRDLQGLADWCVKTNLGIIQILPINDTSANNSWMDSYPYSAISNYALHPQYLAIDVLDFPIPAHLFKEFEEKRIELNNLHSIDYEPMIAGKWKIINEIFKENESKILADKNFKKFIKENTTWLLPYCAFCVQRDQYKTADFTQWKTHKKYIAGKIAPFFDPKNKYFKKAMLHAWVQFQLHLQLTGSVEYLHRLGISLKGDLPIGIYRDSVEAWTEPELFEMNFQTGAPPDQFSDLGQNWGFPTYNWETMKKDGFLWWKNRFQALDQYFDALRIDHILGFFRIWRIPTSATQGNLGYFYPAIPVTLEEFELHQIKFNKERFCDPFINDQILHDHFGEESESVKNKFLNKDPDGNFHFKKEFNTQRKLADHFYKDPNEFGEKLISLSANVLFLVEEKDGIEAFHPRINLNKTDSYQFLNAFEKQQLDFIYQDYFFKRQHDLWYKSAMEKLPTLLNATKMLICGEDLGMVPDCVPEVMDQLGIVALKVQRMPSENIPFYNSENATYLNVVTPSTHDTSTLRQWWKEDRGIIEYYFLEQLKQWGTAPVEMEPAIGDIILKQHLYNNAMLVIFPIQDLLATDHYLRNPNKDEERINDPSEFPHNWKYRMHLNLEDLKNAVNFNSKIAGFVKNSGRG